MRLTLIKPNIGRREHSLYVDEGRMEPLQMGILAALTPKDVEVKFYDDRMESIPFDEKTDLVGITVETFTARRAYEISKEYMDRGVPVVLGGVHIKLIPEEALEHCNGIIIGDAETIWEEVIDDCKKGQLKNVYKAKQPEYPQKGVIPRRDIFEGKGYLPITLLQFSRGCTYRCHFCASSKYFESHHYCRKVDEVVQEIKSQKRKLLFFVDDNIVCNREKAKELFRALIPLKIKWVSQGSMDMLDDPEFMDLMVKSGCLGLVVGFESIKEDSIKSMNKDANFEKVSKHYKREIKLFKDYGLQIWASFTLGHDGDTIESIKATCEFAIKNKFSFAAFNVLMPYPNTDMYEKLKREKLLLYSEKWWLDETYRFNYCPFIPKKMTADELTNVSFLCRSKFNSPLSIIKRAFDFKTNMRTPYKFMLYALYNPLFRKEVFKKQGMKFGLNSNKKIGE